MYYRQTSETTHYKYKIDLKPCSTTSICLNNSTCTNIKSKDDESYTFNCSCKQNYYGAHCEKKIDVCSNKTCSEKGWCIEKNNIAECFCVEYYSGHDCEIKMDVLVQREKKIRATAIIAIFILCVFFLIFPINDALNKILNIKIDFKFKK